MKMNYKKYAIITIVAIILTIVFVFLYGDGINAVAISNAMFTSGMAISIVGLFRMTRKLHMYDLTIFSAKKFFEVVSNKNYSKAESKVGEYNDYVQNNEYTKTFSEYLIIGILIIVISILITL